MNNVLAMIFKQEITLRDAPRSKSFTQSFSFGFHKFLPSLTTKSIESETETLPSSSSCVPASSKTNALVHDDIGVTSIPSISNEKDIDAEYPPYNTISNLYSPPQSAPKTTTTTSLKQSYIILDEHISVGEAFGVLGRVVGNVKSPLEGYYPIEQRTRRAGIKYYEAVDERGSTRVLDSSDEEQPSDGMDEYKSNLPYRLSESANTTLYYSSEHTKKSDSLLKALIGLSVSTCNTVVDSFQLTSTSIKTVSLMHHRLVWQELVSRYKVELMGIVKKNGGRMFLVVGFKIAKDAEIEMRTNTGKEVNGKVAVDVGSASGTSAIGKIQGDTANGGGVQGTGDHGGVWQMAKSMGSGVIATQKRLLNILGYRRERIPGESTFAVEYREVKLKLKLDMELRRLKQERERGASIDNELELKREVEYLRRIIQQREQPPTAGTVALSGGLKMWDPHHELNVNPQYAANSVLLPESPSWFYKQLIAPVVDYVHEFNIFSSSSNKDEVGNYQGDDDDGLAYGGFESSYSSSEDDEDGNHYEYELELGEEVYVQEIDVEEEQDEDFDEGLMYG